MSNQVVTTCDVIINRSLFGLITQASFSFFVKSEAKFVELNVSKVTIAGTDSERKKTIPILLPKVGSTHISGLSTAFRCHAQVRFINELTPFSGLILSFSVTCFISHISMCLQKVYLE